MDEWLNFEKLKGRTLIIGMYRAGLVGIALLTIVLLFWAVGIAKQGGAAVFVVVLPFLVAHSLVMAWRLHCEGKILAFQIYHRLGEIRDRLPEQAESAEPSETKMSARPPALSFGANSEPAADYLG